MGMFDFGVVQRYSILVQRFGCSRPMQFYEGSN